MFERRLKIFLTLLCAVTLVLVIRAGQLQVVQRDRWVKAAAETMVRSELTETVRGALLDCRGRVIARDEACVDACVDYRALVEPPNEAWVNERAVERLKARNDEYVKTPRSKRKALVEAEANAVRADIQQMWVQLAQLSHQTTEQINDVRQAIVNKVEMRRRLVWYRNYKKAQGTNGSAEEESLWRKWLIDGNKEEQPLDNFSVEVSEEKAAHVILRAIDPDLQNELGKHIDRYPGLVLRPGTHRIYPFGPVACHLMGRVTHVGRDDLENDPEKKNDVRAYEINDEIGKGGAEGLCERALRGTRGKIERVLGEEGVRGRTEPIAGRDVPLTVDVELEAQIEDAFAHAELVDNSGAVEQAVLHGAAVVVDVPTGEVRALVSYPTYDANTFDEHYNELHDDEVNQPLLNRATMSQLQPGSTVKPLVGLSAIAQGLSRVNEGIECTGYLVINGRRQAVGRCWVASKFANDPRVPNVAHHPVPFPHEGHDGNPDGFLTFSDALERSCNVYFENIANRLGIEGLSFWMDRFGLGRPTGLGIPEARGRLPRDFKAQNSWDLKYKTWFSGIGQDPVAATPIQMANVAATIARNGVWMRPRLVSDRVAGESGITVPPPATRPGEPPAALVDAVDLHLPADALAAARLGMYNVVNGKAGTGKQIMINAPKLARFAVCGKTGTAQAGRFRVPVLDPVSHKQVHDAEGKPVWRYLEPSTKENPNPEAPWFRGNGKDGKDLNHAWYIGFAPADNPQVAFAVMVEYGGSGGYAAGSVAKKALEACVDHGYLK